MAFGQDIFIVFLSQSFLIEGYYDYTKEEIKRRSWNE